MALNRTDTHIHTGSGYYLKKQTSIQPVEGISGLKICFSGLKKKKNPAAVRRRVHINMCVAWAETGEKHGSIHSRPSRPFFPLFSHWKLRSTKMACSSHARMTRLPWHAFCKVDAGPRYSRASTQRHGENGLPIAFRSARGPGRRNVCVCLACLDRLWLLNVFSGMWGRLQSSARGISGLGSHRPIRGNMQRKDFKSITGNFSLCVLLYNFD